MSSRYFWDIGFDLTSPNLRYGLVEGYSLSTESGTSATLTTSPVFHPGDQVDFNVFNLSPSTCTNVVSSLTLTIDFGERCPFVETPLQFTIPGQGAGEPGNSSAFPGRQYPHWMQWPFIVSKATGRYCFKASLTVNTANGPVSFSLPDPEMIVGSDG
ncbi:MAG TPA: hypothetical protein VEL74_14525 [Thermoanaerobaculia bacterium]|nr:hypothetical protein [Thermoanaerobaculia bacterium]